MINRDCQFYVIDTADWSATTLIEPIVNRYYVIEAIVNRYYVIEADWYKILLKRRLMQPIERFSMWLIIVQTLLSKIVLK